MDTSANPDFVNDIGFLSAMWTGFCSNPERTHDECVAKTEELLNKTTTQTEREGLALWLGKQLFTVSQNRKEPLTDAFLKKMFAIDDKDLALGCVDAAYTFYMRGQNRIHVQTYLDDYDARYDESYELLYLKLRWLVLASNYNANIVEVERIMAAISELDVLKNETVAE